MYRIDLPSTGGDNSIDVGACPFKFLWVPLFPATNEPAGGVQFGTTHITNGCYRLHPVEWNIGEVAGMLAAYWRRARGVPRPSNAKGWSAIGLIFAATSQNV
ncbi:FAD-dependent oxidoreductase [Agrobacterium burrii]